MDHLLLKIAKILPTLKTEQLLIRKLQFKLSNQMRSIKTFHALRKLYSLIDRLIDGCRQILIGEASIITHLKEVKHLNYLVVHLSPLVQEFVRRHFLVQFHLILLGILARIYNVSKDIIKSLELILKINESKIITIPDETNQLISLEQEYSLIEEEFQNEADLPVNNISTLPDIITALPNQNTLQNNNNMVELLFAEIKIDNCQAQIDDLFDMIKIPQQNILDQKNNEQQPKITQNNNICLNQTEMKAIDDIFNVIKLVETAKEPQESQKQEIKEIQLNQQLEMIKPDQIIIQPQECENSKDFINDLKFYELKNQTDKILKTLKIQKISHRKINKKQNTQINFKYKYLFKQLRRFNLLK